MKVCFTGDLFLGGDIVGAECHNFIDSYSFDVADMRIANLEQPVTEYSGRLENKYTLFSSPINLAFAKLFRLDTVALSNNHIQDKCDVGIFDTFQSLKNYNIQYFGAGENSAKAGTPFWIDNKTCVLGYCEFGKSYLKKVQPATIDNPGVNPLSFEKIICDLDGLPDGTKAILHFHWGREHVALPDYELIMLAQKILAHKKVLCIVGMHAHRIQGIVEFNQKKAYMCLGNFLFPNFYIEPPTHISYPHVVPRKIMTTKDYHFVGKPTYKKWRLKNRLSLMVIIDTHALTVEHVPMYQLPNDPIVKEFFGYKKDLVLSMVKFYSLFFKLPRPLYFTLSKINIIVNNICRYTYAFCFLTRQNGIRWGIERTIKFFLNKKSEREALKKHS